MLRITLLLLFLSIFIAPNAQQKSDSLISQTITYHTGQAGEMYLVWDINGWELPDKKYWKENSYVERNMVWSKMNGREDIFSIDMTLPAGTVLDFMFWVPIDSNGDKTDGWDTYAELTYTSKFTENKVMNLDDSGLWMPEKKEFNILEKGLTFFIISLFISVLMIFVFRRKLIFSSISFIIGSLFASLVLIIIVRMQMNDLIEKNQVHVPGAVFPDFLLFIIMCAFFILLIAFLRNYPKIKLLLVIICSILMFSGVIFSLLNIDIVKYLGKPLNYQWLYYSNFLTGQDAKSALSEKLSTKLILNISLFISGILIFAISFSLLPKIISNKVNRVLGVLAFLVLAAGFYQFKTIRYDKGKIINPVWELIRSSINVGKKPKLFSMKVSNETKQFMENYHSQEYKNILDTSGAINNIVLFVLESTPFNLVSLYDSTYDVTPNIKRYRDISSVFTNMYAHLPATVYSMGTMLAGVYPLISYKSMVAEYPKNLIPTITGELRKKQWTSSLFFGADLTYSNMGTYAKNQGFAVCEDNTSITCSYKKFGETNTFLDQLDDRCLVDRYLRWSDSVGEGKKFSMLWTIQTHYKYLFKDKEIEYSKNNKDLNRYLNALKADDHAFGMLMDGLGRRGMLNNTLVILTADHGEAFGTHNQVIHASKIYEENVHVPFILYNPLLFKGQTNNKLGGLIDIAPTISQVVGLKKPKEWQGKSLLSDNKEIDRTFFIAPFNDFLFGTRSGDWKYIYNATINRHELYDLKNDPKELRNVSSQYPKIIENEFEMIAGWVQYHNKSIHKYLK